MRVKKLPGWICLLGHELAARKGGWFCPVCDVKK